MTPSKFANSSNGSRSAASARRIWRRHGNSSSTCVLSNAPSPFARRAPTNLVQFVAEQSRERALGPNTLKFPRRQAQALRTPLCVGAQVDAMMSLPVNGKTSATQRSRHVDRSPRRV